MGISIGAGALAFVACAPASTDTSAPDPGLTGGKLAPVEIEPADAGAPVSDP